jgi:hypothetical protein
MGNSSKIPNPQIPNPNSIPNPKSQQLPNPQLPNPNSKSAIPNYPKSVWDFLEFESFDPVGIWSLGFGILL